MRVIPTVLALSAVAVASTLMGCDVQKTQEGSVTVPKYEVQKTQEGNVTVPKYDVTMPEVKLGTTQAEVSVPKITTEKETMTVPTIGIKTGSEKAAEEDAKKAAQK